MILDIGKRRILRDSSWLVVGIRFWVSAMRHTCLVSTGATYQSWEEPDITDLVHAAECCDWPRLTPPNQPTMPSLAGGRANKAFWFFSAVGGVYAVFVGLLTVPTFQRLYVSRAYRSRLNI